MNIKFVNKCLTNVTWHTNNTYQVQGLLKQSNQYYKFDIRYLNDFPKGEKGKLVNSKSEADKILFEDDKNWILVDTTELKNYMKNNSLKKTTLENLVKNIEWSIIIPKN